MSHSNKCASKSQPFVPTILIYHAALGWSKVELHVCTASPVQQFRVVWPHLPLCADVHLLYAPLSAGTAARWHGTITRPA